MSSAKEKVLVPRKVIRTLYTASQWSLKRKRYPAITADDLSPRATPRTGNQTLTTQWIVVSGNPVVAPGACVPPHRRAGTSVPTPERLEFMDTILALALRGGCDDELATILREDRGLHALVPFLAHSLINIRQTVCSGKKDGEHIRIARLAGAGWAANPYIQDELLHFIPDIVRVLHVLAGEATSPSETVELLKYAKSIADIVHSREG